MAYAWHISNGGSNNNGGTTTKNTPVANGTGAATTASNATVNLSVDSPDLSAVVDNQDAIRLNARTDGVNASDIFKITAHDNALKTVTVSPTPGTTTSGVTWAIGGAFATRQRGLDIVSAGETVKIISNLVIGAAETCLLKRSGSASSPIAIVGCDANGNELSIGSYVVVDSTSFTGHAFHDNNTAYTDYIWRNIRVFGGGAAIGPAATFNLQNSASYRHHFFNCFAGPRLGIGFSTAAIYGSLATYCYATACTGSAGCHGFSGCWNLHYCVSRGNQGTGIRLVASADQPTCIAYCLAHYNTTGGIVWVTGDTIPTIGGIHHCTCDANTSYGLSMNVSSIKEAQTFVTDCIFSNNGTYGLDLGGGAPFAAALTYRNHFHNNTSGNINDGGLGYTEQGMTTGNPLYRNALNADYADYRLDHLSPAIRYDSSNNRIMYAGAFCPILPGQVKAGGVSG